MSIFAKVFVAPAAYDADPDIVIPFEPYEVQFFLDSGAAAIVSPDAKQIATPNEIKVSDGITPVKLRTTATKWWSKQGGGGAGSVRVVATSSK